MQGDINEIMRKIAALDLWETASKYNWVVKPSGSIMPYFCTIGKENEPDSPVNVRLMILEGWQAFHNLVGLHVDRWYGAYVSPSCLPHYEMYVCHGADPILYKCDEGCKPRTILTEYEKTIARKVLWESYGIMMRMETDARLPLRYVDEKAMFGRVEVAPGKWQDAPVPIPKPAEIAENVRIDQALIEELKKLPIDGNWKIEVDFSVHPHILVDTRDQTRYCHVLCAVDADSGEPLIDLKIIIQQDHTIKDLWELMPGALLDGLLKLRHVPGEIKAGNARVFRFLRAICLQLPIKLSLHDSLPKLECFMAKVYKGM